MIAVILAAGKGTRLMPRTQYIPKTLVPVNGKPLLFYLLDAVAEAGITQAVIVAGYKQEVLKSVVGGRYKSVDITYVDNPDFETTNNIHSFALIEGALPKDEDEVFVLESDLLIQHDLLHDMLKVPRAHYALISPMNERLMSPRPCPY